MIRPAASNRRQFRLRAERLDVTIGALCCVPPALAGKVIAPPRTNKSAQDGSGAMTACDPGRCGTAVVGPLIVASRLGVLRHLHLPCATY